MVESAPAFFETDNLYIATYLRSRKQPYLEAVTIQRNGRPFTMFRFRRTSLTEHLITEFWNDQTLQEYITAMQTLKSIIRSKRQANASYQPQ